MTQDSSFICIISAKRKKQPSKFQIPPARNITKRRLRVFPWTSPHLRFPDPVINGGLIFLLQTLKAYLKIRCWWLIFHPRRLPIWPEQKCCGQFGFISSSKVHVITTNDAWRLQCCPDILRIKTSWAIILFCAPSGVLNEPGSKLLVLGMVIQPLIGNPYNGYINPYSTIGLMTIPYCMEIMEV